MDEKTLCGALAGDLDGSFEALVLGYQDRMYRFGLRLTGDALDAEEIAQDTFVSAYRSLARLPRDRVETLRLGAWLYRIALNTARNRARRRRVVTVGTDVDGADGEPGPDDLVERQERNRDLAALVAQLPVRQKETVVLRFIEDLSYAEMAEILDMPLGTVKAHVHRGLRALRAALAERQEVG